MATWVQIRIPLERVSGDHGAVSADTRVPAALVPSALGGDPARSPEPTAPRLYRRTERRVFGGVAGGIADHLGLSPRVVRLVFVVTTFGSGIGVILYAAYWIVLPTRGDPRPRGRLPVWLEYAAAAVVGVVALIAVTQTMSLGGLFVPAMLACLGGALIWRQATDNQRRRWTQWSRSSLGAGTAGRIGRIRLLGGIALVIGGGVLVLARADIGAIGSGLLAMLVTVIGVGLITGPWWIRMVGDLNAERYARARSQERAELAAHLHDSVLQTLALIQRNAESPREVARLARGQERELRTLLYGTRTPFGQLAETLSRVAGEVEDDYAIAVDAVVVGDAAMDDGLNALVAASREALVNAAKHAGVTSVSLYAEVESGACTIYIRDRGVGFDLDEIADDRQGVRGSIIGRVERHGGDVTVRSSVGSGTEVEIRMPVSVPSS